MDKYEIYAVLFFAIVSLSKCTSPTPPKASPQPNPPKQQAPAASNNKRSDDFDLPLMAQASTHLNSYRPQFQFANNRPEPAGWYGFNHFVTRSARHLPFPTERRLRTLLGEGTQLYPMTTFLQSPSIFEQVDLHTLGSVQHYDPFIPPRIVMMDPALKVPRGVLIPVVRQPPPPPAFTKRQRSFPTTSRTSGMQTSANVPTPVTLKIIPLKLTSVDIANALKSVSWMPLPINFMKPNNGDGQQTYSDKRQTMFDDEHDESDLPPPSSHVATPLGITYAEGRRSERFLKKFPPRM